MAGFAEDGCDGPFGAVAFAVEGFDVETGDGGGTGGESVYEGFDGDGFAVSWAVLVGSFGLG